MSLGASEPKVFYSPSTRGFFHGDVHGEETVLIPDPDWVAPELEDGEEPPEQPLVAVVTRPSLIPADAVEISEAYWRSLLDGQGKGGSIEPGPGGVPHLVERPPPTAEHLWAWVRQERNRRLAASDWSQLGDVPDVLKAGWSAYRQALRDLPQHTADPANVDWPNAPA